MVLALALHGIVHSTGNSGNCLFHNDHFYYNHLPTMQSIVSAREVTPSDDIADNMHVTSSTSNVLHC